MVQVPNNFKLSNPQVIASFNFADIQDNTGYVTYYCAMSSGAVYASGALISTNTFYSSPFETSVVGTGEASTDYILKVSKTFETLFNLPRRIRGRALVNVGHRATVGTNTRSTNHFVNAFIMKNDTVLAQASSAVLAVNTGGSNPVDGDQQAFIILPVARTNFKKGDLLKVKLDLYSQVNNVTTNLTVALGHDPQARDPASDYTNGSSQAKAAIPFELD